MRARSPAIPPTVFRSEPVSPYALGRLFQCRRFVRSVYFSSADERRRSYARKCIDAYVACKTAPRIAASNPDDNAKPSLRWSPDGAHYRVDIENAIRRLPREELRKAFWQYAVRIAYGLVNHGDQIDRTTTTALTKAGKVFTEMELSPVTYFRRARP